MEPHVCQINPKGNDTRGEWVAIANGGTSSVSLTGLELTDFTQTQQHVHIYSFPPTTAGTALQLGAGETCFVFTGAGKNEWVTGNSGRRQLLLFADRRASIWNNTGDVAYLRQATSGQFVDSLTVGSPARHPNGH